MTGLERACYLLIAVVAQRMDFLPSLCGAFEIHFTGKQCPLADSTRELTRSARSSFPPHFFSPLPAATQRSNLVPV
jgi:hypothetical protein